MMLNIEELKKKNDLVDAIDWNMTNEEAVRLYLEWGNNWARGNYVIRSKDDVSHYFVINTWGKRPVIYLIKRNSEEAVELAEIFMPEDIKNRFMDGIGYNKGVYAVDGEVREWLKGALSDN